MGSLKNMICHLPQLNFRRYYWMVARFKDIITTLSVTAGAETM